MRQAKDISGRKFGALTTIHLVNLPRKRAWLCRCDCGEVKEAYPSDLLSGRVISCGCEKRKRAGQINHRHGKRSSSIYNRWRHIMARCYKASCANFPNYGGRGIKVCDRWHTFENFYEDMGDPPEGMELDRIDNNAGYSKENCRWVTGSRNCRNKRNNHLITYQGKTQTLTEWAEELGLPYCRIKMRLRLGWSPTQAFEAPINTKKRKLTI